MFKRWFMLGFSPLQSRLVGHHYINIDRSYTRMNLSSNKLVCFDIDGVLLRGSTPITGAGEAIRILQHNDVPYMFLTNGCPTTEIKRAKQLSELLDIKCDPQTVIMAHTPLNESKNEQHKLHLVINQGDCREIIKACGFSNVITIEELNKQYPLLNTFDRNVFHNNKQHHHGHSNSDGSSDYCSTDSEDTGANRNSKKIEGIILLEDPLNWETAYQYILDVMFTGGCLNQNICFDYLDSINNVDTSIIPIYVGSSDFFSVSNSPWPRIAHGAFLTGLEAIYKKATGRPLKYKKLYGKPNLSVYQFLLGRIQSIYPDIEEIYIIGDNPLTDIYGANVFKNYLIENNIGIKIISILVKTGVYNGSNLKKQSQLSSLINLLSDYTPKNESYLIPDFVFNDVTEFIEKFGDNLINK